MSTLLSDKMCDIWRDTDRSPYISIGVISHGVSPACSLLADWLPRKSRASLPMPQYCSCCCIFRKGWSGDRQAILRKCDLEYFLSRVSMPMHVEPDIVLPILSVCLSVCQMPILFQNEWTYRHTFWHSGRGIILVFPAPPPLQNSRGKPLSRGR